MFLVDVFGRRQEYLQLLVVANTLVVAMVALAVALIAGIFLLEIEWEESTSSFWSSYGARMILIGALLFTPSRLYMPPPLD